MGYLLKEALKALCGVNQWSYAIFWKIGCQNLKLLIWEDCYYEPIIYSNSSHVPGIGSSELASKEMQASWAPTEARTSWLGVQAGDKVHSLVTKMMMDNYIHLLGEGLVGRAAFTGNHQWILSDNYTAEAHPPEVINEVSLQFSAGMQTIAVIPVHPHGVVQLGSSLNIMENMGIVNDIRTLIFQLGCVPGALLSESSTKNEHASETAPNCRLPNCFGKSVSADLSGRSRVKDSTPFIANSDNQHRHSSQDLGLVGHTSFTLIKHIQNNLQATGSSLPSPIIGQSSVNPNENHCQLKIIPGMKQNLAFSSQLQNGVSGAEVIPLNSDAWVNQGANLYAQQSIYDQQAAFGSLPADYDSLRSMEQQILSDTIVGNPVSDTLTTTSTGFMISRRTSQLCNGVSGPQKPSSNPHSISDPRIPTNDTTSFVHVGESRQTSDISKTKPPLSNFSDHLTTNCLLSDENCMKSELTTGKERLEHELYQALSVPAAASIEQMNLSDYIPSFHDGSQRVISAGDKEACVKAPSGDDLFDIVGLDFKNKLFDGNWDNFHSNGPETDPLILGRNNSAVLGLQGTGSDVILTNEGESDSGAFSGTATDHLIDAVVKVHSSSKQGSDDNVSCRTSLTKAKSSSAPIASSSSCGANKVSLMQRKLIGVPKSLTKTGVLSSCSYKSVFYDGDGGNLSETNSTYASQISSWVEQEHDMKRSSGLSSAYSKRPDEISKSNRKRLKPGENPRPRPKDRQMIQDRVKELREIVPNGAKCSIDALLERTIKHMVFLQSITKHADKLKQTCDSKIVNKKGGLTLRDNFEGGATWAYEVGSQSMVCPIIVEDLNSPRQMLVEMLCEERGLFLEIAEIIRGLGLTILKGVMESRNEKIWAHFTVEANRDVTRMEIFISLVRLLEETVKNSAASANCSDNANMVVQKSFHQAASIPATGRHSSLQ